MMFLFINRFYLALFGASEALQMALYKNALFFV